MWLRRASKLDTKLSLRTEQRRGYFQRCRPREEAMKGGRGIGGDEDGGGGDVSDVLAGATEILKSPCTSSLMCDDD